MHYIKVFTAAGRRRNFHEKENRRVQMQIYLKKIVPPQQIRLFKSHCNLTGASKSIYSQFALSRHCLRKYANFGLVCGVKPSSW
jgi:ribosomal protein S14